MDWIIFVILQVIFEPSLSVLFTVEAEKTLYTSDFGGDVEMGCRFHPRVLNLTADLKVMWHWKTSSTVREVYQMINGQEHSASQEYQGRVELSKDELIDGWAKLKISKLRITDSGTYQCFVQTGEGADYKIITLSVTAPFKAVTKRIEKAAEGDEVLLTCQSEGYPESPVVWLDGHLQRIKPNTTVVSTPDQLFNITSQIRVSSLSKNNYTCNFTNDSNSTTFHVPDEVPVPQVKSDTLNIVLSIGVVMIVITVAVLLYRQRKGFNTPSRDLLVDGRGKNVSAAVCLQINEDKEEEPTVFNENCTEENLGAFLKAYYSDTSFSAEVRHHWEAFGADELRQRLQNNEGQAVNPQALLPEAGETLFLEGPPGSGKTAVAHILVSSWTEGPTHALSDLFDLSTLQLLFYVDCSNVKGDLFQEIVTQLFLKKKISTQLDLRTVLIRSSGALLLLDGYREGNQFFDESLKRFLIERRACRVLVMACMGHCPTMEETVGAGVLKLQTQTVKY
ncbi:immunoglobulin superfamily member 11-like isoform X1 [Seriola aureovittata]|uniref:immunoglobulin superfamily member 11-like isoform X1 n=2 Tax=Seriola aureovittata TaxID=2871759 RepID=UPI0024BEB0D4|nr:immunoglobulin superfamily member 11-like isoform X1 [Seriola aureovittata]